MELNLLELMARFAELPLRAFEFRGHRGKRRVVSFGLRYDFAEARVHRTEATFRTVRAP